jgi:ABC-type transporter Mla subunit MlaD
VVYAIVGLAVACFGMIIWMAVWVSRLKGEIAEERDRAMSWERKHSDAVLQARRWAGECRTLTTQLAKLRAAFEEVVNALEAGGGDVSSFAARLRDGMS